jgi:hypothetical protein
MPSKRVLPPDYMIYKLPKPLNEIAVHNDPEHTRKEKEETVLKYHRDHPNKFLNYIADKFGISKSSFKYRVKNRSIIKKIHISQQRLSIEEESIFVK